MKGKKIFTSLVAGAFALTLFAGTALADDDKKERIEKKGKLKQELRLEQKKDTIKARIYEKKQEIKKIQIQIKEIKKETKNAKKKFKYDDKKIKKDVFMLKERFNQMQQPVTYQQAVALTVKAMGYDLEAQARMNDVLIPKYQVAPWARGYVSAAVYKDIITIEEFNKYNPNKPITRADLAVMLVKAKGLSVNNSAYLTVKDAAYIPTEQVPYVAKALEMGWFTANKNNEFQPNKPVTRAVFASAFIKAGFNAAAFMPKYYELKGKLEEAVSNPLAITLTVKDTQLAYGVYDNAKITINGKNAKYTDLKAGMTVKIRIADNVIVEVNATTSENI